jgi:hypothetical protein
VALKEAGIPRAGKTRPEFCASWTISEGLYRKMQDEGTGPDEIEVGGRYIIPNEAEQRWVAARIMAAQKKKVPV